MPPTTKLAPIEHVTLGAGVVCCFTICGAVLGIVILTFWVMRPISYYIPLVVAALWLVGRWADDQPLLPHWRKP